MPVRLFVGNLPYSTTEEELREYFTPVAEPLQIVLPVDRETGRPRGFAFVDVADRGLADEAIRRFDTQPFKGRRLAVSEARGREDRPPGPRPAVPARPGWSGVPGATPAIPRGPGDRVGRPPTPDTTPRRQRAEPKRDRKERPDKGPKGPIRERTTGRFYALEDDSEADVSNFDDFATSAPETDAGSGDDEQE